MENKYICHLDVDLCLEGKTFTREIFISTTASSEDLAARQSEMYVRNKYPLYLGGSVLDCRVTDVKRFDREKDQI